MNHLTDEELASWMAGEASPQTRAHVDSCLQCAAEARELRDGVSRYALAMRRQSSEAESLQLSGTLAPRRALAMHRMRWAGAAVLALLLIASTAWLVKTHREPAIAGPSTGISVTPLREAQAQPASQMSDDELLEAVNDDLSRQVPLALAPVSAITEARNKIAAASSPAATSGKQSERSSRRKTNVP